MNFHNLKKGYEKSVLIDWISCTLPYKTTIPIVPHDEKEVINGWNGYSAGWRLDSGVLVYLNPDRPDMGLHIRISGKALANLKEKRGIDPLVLLSRLKEGGGQFSRLDLAMDIKNGGLDVMEFIVLVELGLWKSDARKYSVVMDGSDGKGKTLYVGRRTSKVSMRIYDKGAETMSKTPEKDRERGEDGQVLPGEDWIRFELELKQEKAVVAAIDMIAAWKAASVNDDEWLEKGYQLVPGMIKGFCQFSASKNYHDVCGEKGVKILIEKKKQTNTEKWLFNAVAPVLVRLTVEQGREFKMLFLQHVSDLEKELRDDKKKAAFKMDGASSFDELPLPERMQ